MWFDWQTPMIPLYHKLYLKFQQVGIHFSLDLVAAEYSTNEEIFSPSTCNWLPQSNIKQVIFITEEFQQKINLKSSRK